MQQEELRTELESVTHSVGGGMVSSGSYSRIESRTRWRGNGNKTYYLHPLDMVYLISKDEEGKEVKTLVPAIFIKDQAFQRQWSEISQLIRIGVNVFLIAVSLFTLVSGPGALMTVLAIADLGFAGGDLTIQAFEEKIRKYPWGEEFLDGWEKVYAFGPIVIGLPALGLLLKNGAKLLPRVASGEARVQLKAMLKYSLFDTGNFSHVLKDGFIVITDYSRYLKSSMSGMKKLGNEGVLLLKGTDKGSSESKLFLSYRGIELFSGKAKDVSKEIRNILNRAGNRIGEYVNKVLFSKYLRYIESGGARGEIPLTAIQKKECLDYAMKYGISEEAVYFSSEFGVNTGYKRFFGVQDKLNINSDVMPGLNGTSANSKVTWKGAIAHELEGHRAAELAGKTQQNFYWEEAQASMRASIHGKDLTKRERNILKQDAVERLNGTMWKLEDIIDQLWLDKY